MLTRLFKSVVFAVVAALAATAAASEIQPGEQSRWSLDFRVRLEQSSLPSVEVHLLSDWVSTVVAVRPGEYDAQLQLADIRFVGDAVKNVPATSVKDLQQRLAHPFWATYRTDGGLSAVRFFRGASPADQNLLQMIATELQFVRTPAARESWTAQERDGAGEYLALYVMAHPDRVIKRKLKYLYPDSVAGAPANAIGLAIEASNVTFALAPDGTVRAVDGSSRIRFDLSFQHAPQIAAISEIHLDNPRTLRAPDLIGSLERALPDLTASSIMTHQADPAEARAAADDRLLDTRNTESLLAAAFAKDGDDPSLSDRLSALFRRRPESASAAVAELKLKGSRRRVTNALAIAGTPAAFAALSSLATDPALIDDLRVDALVGLVQAQHPTADAMRIPSSLVNDPKVAVRSAARLMSGTMSHAGRHEHPVEADAIDASLIGLYRASSNESDARELLGALGNSAGPSVVPVIEEALHDSRTVVRAAAARALRLVPGPDVDRTLAAVISSDRDPEVRANAIFAARFRQPLPTPIAEALVQAASTDDADYVRSDAVAVLRQNPNASPRIAETLARVADRDRNPGIRGQARQSLLSEQGTLLPKPPQ